MSAPASTRLIQATPQLLLRRLGRADQELVLLLVALGAEAARERLELLEPARRTLLAPRVEEVLALPRPERHALFALKVPPPPPPATVASERPRLSRLQKGTGSPVPPARDAALARALRRMGRRARLT